MKKTEDMFEVLKRDVEIPDIVMKKSGRCVCKNSRGSKNSGEDKNNAPFLEDKKKKDSGKEAVPCGSSRYARRRGSDCRRGSIYALE